MDSLPRKQLVECPRCRSAEVHVPWEPMRSTERRSSARTLAFLWATSLVWPLVAIVTGAWMWLLFLAVYVIATVMAAVSIYRSLHRYQCARCHLQWTP